MTEQQMGGTAPEPEDQTSATDQASEQTVGTVAVADEPASTAETSEPTETSSSTLSQAVDPATGRRRANAQLRRPRPTLSKALSPSPRPSLSKALSPSPRPIPGHCPNPSQRPNLPSQSRRWQ